MKLDPPDAATGKIILGSGLEVGRGLREEDFLTSIEGRQSQPIVSNPPYTSYRLSSSYEFDGKNAGLILSFVQRTLKSVSIFLVDAGQTWSSWSESEEMRLKVVQDAILAKKYGPPPHRFAWGEIASEYDRRSGSSQITVRYND